MGLIRWGILGGFSRKIGTVVGAYWRGLDVVRGLPRRSDKPLSQAQVDAMLKIGMISHLLSYISDLISIGYGYNPRGATAMNKAVSDNYKSAIVGTSPDFSIDPSRLIFSKGPLYVPVNTVVEVRSGAVLTFTWDYVRESKYEKPIDQLTVLIFNADRMEFISFQRAAVRMDLHFNLQLPMAFVGDEVYCYISFNTDQDTPKSSDSRYIGQLRVI